MNIFDNCIKYGEFGSTIEVNQWIQKSTDMAIITIRGESMHPLPAAELDTIFGLGTRGSNAKKIVASGTGLGLYICRQIVEQDHNGNIAVQPDGHKGILFTIKLPFGEGG